MSAMKAGTRPLARWGLTGAAVLASLYAGFLLYAQAEPLFGAMFLALAVAVGVVFLHPKSATWRFVLPGIAAVLIFVAFPVVYTIWLGFTNYSSFNLLTYDRAVEVLMANKSIDPSTERKFVIAGGPGAYQVWLPEDGLLSEPMVLNGQAVTSLLSSASEPAALLPQKEAVKLRKGLAEIVLIAPDGTELRNTGLRAFAAVAPEYERLGPDEFRRVADGVTLTANHKTGFFTLGDGTTITPGWRVGIGWDNFKRIFTLEGIRGPMLSIFVWTCVFAFLSMAGTFALGLLLAVILQWPHLRGKAAYRILLILPYAVPSFISILVFRGLFNQNFGEINLILEAMFGLRPDWFTDGNLARIMILTVNLWLGYPYMMLLAMGFLQAVPEDHKKAAALEGASALRVFFTITLPQILPPFVPLLISTFAFNFNNIVLVLLMTRGGPDIPGTAIPAGETDILGSFTYRVAFMDTGTQFGLAGAITFLIFLIVGAIAYANLLAMRRAALRKGARI